MTSKSNVRKEVKLPQRLSAELAVHKTGLEIDRSILAPACYRPVGHHPEKAALQIARFGARVPGGLDFLVSVRPILRPFGAVVPQVVRPSPQFFSVRQPEGFLAGLAPADVSHFVLFRAVLVKIGFRAVE